ncbi:MAG: hypothetical protein L3K00_06580 [Thermoplasmata archaeon]|nr:hypothetical protein [Thermoplasmata archaeon]
MSALASSAFAWPRWARFTPALSRYAEPFATGAGIAVGGTFLGALLEGLRITAPEAALVLGAGALAGTLTVWGSSPRRAPLLVPPPSRATPKPRPDGGVVCARCQSSVPAHEWAEIVRRAWHTTSSGPRSHSQGLSASPNVPGEAIWGQWASEEPGRLPVDLVGPVPETAWIPPHPGAVVPFPDREPQWFVVDGELVSAPQGPTIPGTPTPDRLSTTEVAPTSEFPATLEPTPAYPPAAGPDITLIPAIADAFEPELEYDWITAEALHPLPPHLRATPPKAPAKFHAHAPEKPRSCASCSRELPPTARARPCPECRQPVCLTCRTQAVVNYGQTWCQGCAATRQWNIPLPEGPWAPGSPAAAAAPPAGPAPAN